MHGFTVPPGIDDNDQPVEACTEYVLAVPRASWVRMDTTVMNLGGTTQRLLVGDWYNPGGQLEQWDKPFQLGEALRAFFDPISFFGYGEEEGVDYGYTTLPLDAPVPPGAGASDVFTTSGVSVVLHHLGAWSALTGTDPPFFVWVSSARSAAIAASSASGMARRAAASRWSMRSRESPTAASRDASRWGARRRPAPASRCDGGPRGRGSRA